MVVRVEEEKGGSDDGANEDEEKALLAEKIGDYGTGERGARVVLLLSFYGVGGAVGWDLVLVTA